MIASDGYAMDTAASPPLWCRVESNGSTVTVKTVNSSSAPSEGTWSSTSACISSSSFEFKGGLFGFCANGYGYIDNLTIKSWNTSTSAFDITEHVDEFTTNGSNYAEETIDYDRNGNLSYDGLQKYSYDAWNRMVAIAHAYRSSGTVSAGQSSVTMKYDGKGRRIQKAISNTGAWDCTYKYYYDNDSCIEERNGSDYVIKENTWGTNYIDELVQVKAESDGTLSTSALSGTDSRFFACQDANYNVLGLVNASGALVERYEYSPYGQRKTFFSAGTNDPGNYAPTLSSQRASSTAAWSKNEFGHQGLMHDEEIDLVYNRARMLHPGLGRFAQRDPIEYADGLSLYGYVRSHPTTLRDPSGNIAPVVAGAVVLAAVACIAPEMIYASNVEEWGSRDKMKHCYVSCKASRNCQRHLVGAAGWSREIIQAALEELGFGHFENIDDAIADMFADAEANAIGRECAGWETYIPLAGNIGRCFRQSCNDCCEQAAKTHGYQNGW